MKALFLPVFITFATTVLAASARAQLVLEEPGVHVQVAGPAQPNTVLRAPWKQVLRVADSYVRADLAAGTLRAGSRWTGALQSAVVQIGYTGAQFVLRNTGGTTVSFPAGALKMRVTAATTGRVGTDPFGSYSTTLTAHLSGTVPHLSSAGVVHVTALRGATRLLDVRPNDNGGTTTIHAGDESGLDAELAFAAFTIAPGGRAALSLALNTGAYGEFDWGAVTDATHTARLSLRLPPGVTLNAPVPLRWVR